MTLFKNETKTMPHLYIFLGLLVVGMLASCFMV